MIVRLLSLAIMFAFAFAFTLAAGCGPVGPKPARLDASKATAIQVATVGGGLRFCPGGEAPQLEVAVTTTDGKRLDTWSRGEGRDGKLPFNVFEYTTSWGQIDGDGFVRLPDDSIAAIGRTVTVEVRVAERPDLVGQLALEPDLGCGGTLGGVGPAGSSGWSGDSGQSGRPGANSDTSDGTAGERGADGGPGSDGGPGGAGPRVTAALAYVDAPTGQRLVVLRTWVGGAASTTVFDPAGERWAVIAFGGDGGGGGSGGRGGSGGSGGNGRYATSSSSSGSGSGSGSSSGSAGTPGTNGGPGGDGGRGGDGGNGGDGGLGGSIELIYDAAFPDLVDRVILDTRGGRGGAAGWAGDGGSGGSGGSGERRGYDGRSGQGGRTGVGGRDGGPGTRPTSAPGDVRRLFADLAERGLVISR